MYRDRDPYVIRKDKRKKNDQENRKQLKIERKIERRRLKEERKNRPKVAIKYPKFMHIIPFFRPPPEPPLYAFDNPLHHIQRLDRDQIQTSYECCEVLQLFPLSFRKTKSGPCRINENNINCQVKTLNHFISILKRVRRKKNHQNIYKYASSFYKSYETRKKSLQLWPKTSIMKPFQIINYTMSSWIKMSVEKYRTVQKDKLEEGKGENGDKIGSNIVPTYQGVGVKYKNTELQEYLSFIYIIDSNSTLNHLKCYKIKSMNKIINTSVKKGNDMNVTLKNEYGTIDNDGSSGGDSDGSSDGSSSSSSSSSGSDDDDDDGSVGNEEDKKLNTSNVVPNVSPFNMDLYDTILKEKKRIVKLFEKCVIQCIQEYNNEQASIYRASSRLNIFIDEKEWYCKASQFNDKPNDFKYFHRSWTSKKPPKKAGTSYYCKENYFINNNDNSKEEEEILENGRYEGKYGVEGGGQAWGRDHDLSRARIKPARKLIPSIDMKVLKLKSRNK